MSKGKIRVAVCQFAESFSARRNAAIVRRYLARAKAARAELVHFHEACMTGYLARPEAPPRDEAYWQTLRECTRQICADAARLKLWVVLGSAHPLTPPNKPANCLYLIGPDGAIRDRYDKRFCTGGDLRAYTPGDRFVTFDLNGVKCALLICFDLRFPELYRQLCLKGVQALFQSFHNAYMDGPGIHNQIMRRTVQAHAGINYVWISANNSSGHYSRWPSVLVRPDGSVAATLRQNAAGMFVQTIDTTRRFYDASADFRAAAIGGKLHSGRLVRDPRQQRVTAL
jgi:predicted amidohydrolase